MRPEDKVVSLEMAKKLKEAGFPQETERWWVLHYPDSLVLPGPTWQVLPICEFVHWKNDEYLAYAAPDAQEMGLPESVGTDGLHGHLHIGYGTREVGKWTVGYANYERKCSEIFDHENEAEARAACWLWLKENGLI